MPLRALAVLALSAGTALALAGGATCAASSSATSRMALPGLRIDVVRAQVTLPARVALRQGGLEFLLCLEGTKDYESVLSTRTLPSNVHAALLALGLSPGRPGHWVKTGDAPARFVPPAGPLVDVTVRWKGKDGDVELPAWKLLKPNRVAQSAGAIKWVFVGSQMTDQGRYLADLDGTLISVSNFSASTLDVPFVSTDQNALLEFSSNTDLLPEQGTEVEVVLTPDRQAASAPAARLLVSVDRFGRMELDGRHVSPDQLEEQARSFLAVHNQAAAEVRIDAQALVYDHQLVQEALRRAGLEEIDFHVVTKAEVPPRTMEETERALAQWREQLAAEGDLLGEQIQEADRLIQGLQERQEELRRLGDLWQHYAVQLQTLVRNRPASRPATQASRPVE